MEGSIRGTPLHTRALGITLLRREDGDLDAVGTIVDLRKRGLVAMPGDLQTSGLIHEMRVLARLSEAREQVLSMACEQERVVFEPSEATGGESCRDPAGRLAAVAGAPLAQAHRALGDAIGGPRGCSHILTLSQLLVSGAQQCFRHPQEHDDARFRPGERVFRRNLLIDGFVENGRLQIALVLDDIHSAPTAPVLLEDPGARLGRRHEVRAVVEIDGEALSVAAVRAAERTHTADASHGGWMSRDADLASLVGAPAFGGMAGRLFGLFGDRVEDAPLLDALLNLSPAMIQVMPAWMYDRDEDDRENTRNDAQEAGARMTPQAMTGACYMWRADGFLTRGARASDGSSRSD